MCCAFFEATYKRTDEFLGKIILSRETLKENRDFLPAIWGRLFFFHAGVFSCVTKREKVCICHTRLNELSLTGNSVHLLAKNSCNATLALFAPSQDSHWQQICFIGLSCLSAGIYAETKYKKPSRISQKHSRFSHYLQHKPFWREKQVTLVRPVQETSFGRILGNWNISCYSRV